jgi:hypothetical protein
VNSLALVESWRPVERLSIVTTLGIRFWDPAFDVQVDDGLTVTAYPFGARRPATPAFRTPSGVYAFQGLPGLHDIEYPRGDPASPGSLPASLRFLIEVSDTASRFLSVAFFVDTPFDGIFPTDLPQAPGAVAPPGFYLFSAPTRGATPLIAVVRAQVSEAVDATSEQSASYAVMEVDTPAGDTWIGIADDRGMVALLFPYPTFTGTYNFPSSTMPSAAMAQQSWPITLRIRYQPSALSFPPGSILPELRSVLAQSPAAIFTQRTVPPGQAVTSLAATLVFGQELVMRSALESVLLVGLGSLP